MFKRIKSDPNPIGEENFFFINAWNEWGEGNTLEASERWGDGYLKALNEAMEYAEQHVSWSPHLLLDSAKSNKQAEDSASQTDVCVVIREFHATYPWQEIWTLDQTISSLRDMKNPNWRAVVASVLEDNEGDEQKLNVTVIDAYEPRLIHTRIPADIREEAAGASAGSAATDWMIQNLDSISPGCGNAKYLLITNSTNRYEPNTFDVIANASTDVIGLNFESMESMALVKEKGSGEFSWDERCERFDTGHSSTCMSATAESELLDLGAVLFNLKKWRQEDISLSSSMQGSEETTILQHLAKRSPPWSWKSGGSDPATSCHLLRPGAMTTCTRSGRFWVDVPDVKPYESGCYSGWSMQNRYPHHKVPDEWDYARFDGSPFCVRLSQKMYKEVTDKGS